MRMLFVIVLFSSLGCGKKNYPQTDNVECKAYFKLIKKDWKKREDGTFYFQSLKSYDEIFKGDHYNKMRCVGDLSDDEVRFLYGEPSKIHHFEKVDGMVFIYCMGIRCAPSTNSNIENARLSISFDSNNKVKDIYFSPHPPDKG